MDAVATRAVVVTQHGCPDVLEVQDRPAPEPGPGEALVEVVAAGVNFIDVYKREGIYPGSTPFVLGEELSGTVVAVGAGVEGLRLGDRVASASAHGGLATHALVPADLLVPVPDGVELDVACAAMLQGMTAHYLVTSTYPVREGDEVLVHAAAGGVGQLLEEAIHRLEGPDHLEQVDGGSGVEAGVELLEQIVERPGHPALTRLRQAQEDRPAVGRVRPPIDETLPFQPLHGARDAAAGLGEQVGQGAR